MARTSWFDENTNLPLLDEEVQKLEHFTAAIADGKVERDELEKQQKALVDAMKAVEGDLSDEQHEKVTRLLLELTAYNVMTVLHELAAERVRKAFSR